MLTSNRLFKPCIAPSLLCSWVPRRQCFYEMFRNIESQEPGCLAEPYQGSIDRGAFAPWQLIFSAAWRTNSSSVYPWAGNDSASENAAYNKALPEDEVAYGR